MPTAVADQRILRGVPATLTWQAVDADGNETDPGTTTVAVTADDGTVVLDAGTATTGTGTAPRTVALAAAKNTRLDLLTVTWASASAGTQTTVVEVVGGYYFSITEARASDTTLTNDTKYPDARILAVRREVEDEFERICGVAFVPRYGRFVVPASSNGMAILPPALRSVRSVTPTGGTTYSTDQLAGLTVTSYGAISGLGQCGSTIAVEHGFDRCPPEIKTAAMIRLRSRLNFAFSGIPDKAKSLPDSGLGTFEIGEADGTSTGIPEVDAVLHRPGYNFSAVVA